MTPTPSDRPPWIHSPGLDLLFILAPPFLLSALVLSLPGTFDLTLESPLWAGFAITLCDLGHQYATYYRTYFDVGELRQRPFLYTLVPLFCWLGLIVLYSLGRLVMWRCLVYLAIYHFIRQQWGLFSIYARNQGPQPAWARWLDRAAVYTATLYPWVHVHLNLPRNYGWYFRGDFINLALPRYLDGYARGLWFVVLAAYAAKEARQWALRRALNLPKNLVLLGTVVWWYTAMVRFNGEFSFATVNALSHGIPYLALVWVYGNRRWNPGPPRKTPAGRSLLRVVFRPAMVPVYLCSLALLAYAESAAWDAFDDRSRPLLFGWMYGASRLTNDQILAWFIPLLAVPQATHYVLDAFIWRVRKGDLRWRAVI